MKFGERIEAAMKHLGWGPTDLAKASGVAMATISALVRRASDRSDYKEALVQGFPASKISHEWLRSEVGEMEAAEPTQPPTEAAFFRLSLPCLTPSPEGREGECSDDQQTNATSVDFIINTCYS